MSYSPTIDAYNAAHGVGSGVVAGIEHWGNELVSLVDNIGNSLLGLGVKAAGGAVLATTGINILTSKDTGIPDFSERAPETPVIIPNLPAIPRLSNEIAHAKDILSVKKDMGIVCDISPEELGTLARVETPFQAAAIAQSRDSGFSRFLS